MRFLLCFLLFFFCLFPPLYSVSYQEGENREVENDSYLKKDSQSGNKSFTFSPGDSFTINVLRHEELNRSVRLTPDGNIYLPLIGEIKAERLTVNQLRKDITRQLSEYFVNPRVDINIDKLVSQKVYVLGEVVSPGPVSYEGDIHIFEAISESGGFTEDADKENIFLVTQAGRRLKVTVVDYAALFKSGKIEADHYLENKNVVYVKKSKLANLAAFMQRLDTVLGPVISTEHIIVLGSDAVDVVTGEEEDQENYIVVPDE